MSKVKKKYITEIVALVLIAIALGISCAFSYDIEVATGLLHPEETTDRVDGLAAQRYNASAHVFGTLEVHFVAVGQGDCTIIELPDGKTMIVDGADQGATRVKNITDFIEAELPADFKYFDYAILTHPDADHCGSLDDVLGKYPARVSYRPNVEATGTKSNPYVDPGKSDLSADAVKKDTAVYAKALQAMYQSNDDFTPTVYVTDPSVAAQTIVGSAGEDKYALHFYSPLSTNYKSEWNEYSPIMVLEYRGFKFAMSGDAEKENEAEFVSKVNSAPNDGVTDKYDAFTDDFCVNVFKAGHHGSRTSSSQGYLDVMTTPDGAKDAYYIFSCDPNDGNDYKHPHTETLERLAAMGVPDENMLRTDLLGSLSFVVKPNADGAYSLYFGEKTLSPKGGTTIDDSEAVEITPTPTPTPDTAPDTEVKLVYYKIGSIDVTWPLVAWVGYAVLVLAVIVYSVLTKSNDASNNGGKRGGKRGRS